MSQQSYELDVLLLSFTLSHGLQGNKCSDNNKTGSFGVIMKSLSKEVLLDRNLNAKNGKIWGKNLSGMISLVRWEKGKV